MARANSESYIQGKVVDYARGRQWLVIPEGQNGLPDRLLISPHGLHVWIEFKKPGGNRALRQKAIWRKMSSMYCKVYVCQSVEHGKNIIDFWHEMGTACLSGKGDPIDDFPSSGWDNTGPWTGQDVVLSSSK